MTAFLANSIMAACSFSWGRVAWVNPGTLTNAIESTVRHRTDSRYGPGTHLSIGKPAAGILSHHKKKSEADCKLSSPCGEPMVGTRHAGLPLRCKASGSRRIEVSRFKLAARPKCVR